MPNCYEYVLVDSYQRSDGTPTDFSFQLNKPIRNIEAVELVHSSFSNTLYTFTSDDVFYWQEETDTYPQYKITDEALYSLQYVEDGVLTLTQDKYFHFSVEHTYEDNSFNPVTEVLPGTQQYYTITIRKDAQDWTLDALLQYIQLQMRLLSGLDSFEVLTYSTTYDRISILSGQNNVKFRLYAGTNTIYEALTIRNIPSSYTVAVHSDTVPHFESSTRNVVFAQANQPFYTMTTIENAFRLAFNAVSSPGSITINAQYATDQIQITSNARPIKFLPNVFGIEADVYSTVHETQNINLRQVIRSFTFPYGSYSQEQVIDIIDTRLNASNPNGNYRSTVENFKYAVSASINFKLLFSRWNSPYKQLGFANRDTALGSEHVSNHTISLEATDAILVNIASIPTIITTKNTCGTFLIPVTSLRGEVQSINKNDSFEQIVYVKNLDLSKLKVTLLDTDGKLLRSDELNMKLMLKCYTAC